MLAVFGMHSLFMAVNLDTGIIPDEPAHYIFSKYFATTFGIPPDTAETYSWGWYIEQNPFLYYWINGRIINLIRVVSPQITDINLLLSLRFVNILYGFGTIFFCYLLTKQVIKGRWWQLLPVFLLTQTLMFIFLSAGINYDNLANLFSMAGLYFLIRAFKSKQLVKNSLLWIIMIALGTLVKYTILPLALAMTVAWVIFIIKNNPAVETCPLKSPKIIFLAVTALLLLVVNVAIYGVNLIRYQALTPPCQEILLESQCEVSPYARRFNQIALAPKLSIQESVAQGYPSPIQYALIDWVWHMLNRSFGMVGHLSYFPLHLIPFYQIWFYLILLFGGFNLLYYRKLSFSSISLIGVGLFYTAVLFFNNYNSELVYGFIQIAFQGRYIFPVIGALFILVAKIIKSTPIKVFRWALLIFTIALFSYGGSSTIWRGANTFLIDWFTR
jgi:hypothetical protein